MPAPCLYIEEFQQIIDEGSVMHFTTDTFTIRTKRCEAVRLYAKLGAVLRQSPPQAEILAIEREEKQGGHG